MSDTTDTEQPCGHPWSALVEVDPETLTCGACLDECRRGQAPAHEEGEA